jgi:hypothetical protein
MQSPFGAHGLTAVPLPPAATDAARRSILRRGFPADGIVQGYTFSAATGQNGERVGTNATVFADAVHRTPAQYASMTVFNVRDGLIERAVVEQLAQSAAPFHLLHKEGRFSLWISDRQSGQSRNECVKDRIDYEWLDEVLAGFADDLTPARIIDVKQDRARFTHPAFADMRPYQLALWAIEATRPVLVRTFTAAVAEVRSTLRQQDVTTTEQTILEIGVQLLGACILGDTGTLGSVAQSPNVALSLLIREAHERFPSYFRPEFMATYTEATARAYDILRQVSYANFVPDMLTELYRKAYPPQQTRALGRYDTPLYLTRRMWEAIPVELLPPDQRLTVDMTCGWGSFLIAGYERLTRLTDQSRNLLRPSLIGNDSDYLTARLARLALLISTSDDSWHVDDEDALSWNWLSTRRPNIIVGNPPFAGDRKTQRSTGEQPTRAQLADRFLQRAIDRLAPEGYLAMLVPQSFAVAQASPTVRKALLEQCDLFELWELPVGVFESGSGRTTSLFARKRRDTALPNHAPVRIRTLQGRRTLEAFRETGIFTSSTITGDQSAWSEQSRRPHGSTNTHMMDYRAIMAPANWGALQERCLRLDTVATIISGGIEGRNPERKRKRGNVIPKPVQWLTGAKQSMPDAFRINYNHTRVITYPDDLEGPRLNDEELLAGKKVLVLSVSDPSWGQRLKVAIEDRGCYVSNSFWVVVPKPFGDAPPYAHEVIAAVVQWKVANAWIIEHLKYPGIPANALHELPFPVQLSDTDQGSLAAAVQALTQAAIQGEPAPRAATARIDDILRAAYDLDTATYDRLRIVAEWDQTALVSVDPLPVSDVDAPHILRGVVEAVEPAQGRITLWIDEFDALQHVPIDPAMPGWLLRPGAPFRVHVPKAAARQRSLAGIRCGRFEVQEYAYLDEAELLASLSEQLYRDAEAVHGR